MRKEIVFSILPLILCALHPADVNAGDQAVFHLIGFSPCGEYAAWRTGGIQDGSGFQWVACEVLNTHTSLQVDYHRHVWDEYLDELPDSTTLSETDRKIEDLCSLWEIDLEQPCTPLLYHFLTDLGVRRDTVLFCLQNYVPDYHSPEITLTLRNEPADIEQNYPEWFPAPVTPLLEIYMNGQKNIFFQETTIPDCWRMSTSYGIYAVYRNPYIQNNLLIVLNSTEPGFEGPNGRFRVVSGKLSDGV